MPTDSKNLRKAAIFIRSVDADTAARLLAQLAPEEARLVREAIRTLGELDPEEQADIAAELRRAAPVAGKSETPGVELQLTAPAAQAAAEQFSSPLPTAKRFEFLEQAPSEALAQFLAREHVQTIAVVLSYLAPQRAAEVLSALPDALQADTIERLSSLGDSDPDSLVVVERELSAWLAKRSDGRLRTSRRGGTVMSILSAANEDTRDRILASLHTHKTSLAKQLVPLMPATHDKNACATKSVGARNRQADGLVARDLAPPKAPSPPRPVHKPQPPAPHFPFDDLKYLSAGELSAVVRDLDPHVLVLALAGSCDELVDRICDPMPRRMAKAFRRQLARLGPTRLSDVEAAQQLVAAAAARRFGHRRQRLASTT